MGAGDYRSNRRRKSICSKPLSQSALLGDHRTAICRDEQNGSECETLWLAKCSAQTDIHPNLKIQRSPNGIRNSEDEHLASVCGKMQRFIRMEPVLATRRSPLLGGSFYPLAPSHACLSPSGSRNRAALISEFLSNA
jgi:hypothetical protein